MRCLCTFSALLLCCSSSVVFAAEGAPAQNSEFGEPTTAFTQPPAPIEEGLNFSRNAMLRADGTLVGNITVLNPTLERVVPATDATISFVQRGRVQASARTGNRGEFLVEGIRAGYYSVFVSSPTGFAALAVLIVPFAEPVSTTPEKTKVKTAALTTVVAPPAQSLDINSMVPLEDFAAVNPMDPNMPVDPMAGAPMGAPMMGGFGGGSGGGGGGGGGFGALLGAAGLAAGIAALATNDDLVPPPASPDTP